MGINEVVVNPCARCDSPEPLQKLICAWCGNPVYEFQTFRNRMHWCCHAHRTRRSARIYFFAVLGGPLLIGGCLSFVGIFVGSRLGIPWLKLCIGLFLSGFCITVPVAVIIALTVAAVRAVRCSISDRNAFTSDDQGG